MGGQGVKTPSFSLYAETWRLDALVGSGGPRGALVHGERGRRRHRFASGPPAEPAGREAAASPCSVQDDGDLSVRGGRTRGPPLRDVRGGGGPWDDIAAQVCGRRGVKAPHVVPYGEGMCPDIALRAIGRTRGPPLQISSCGRWADIPSEVRPVR